MPKPVTLIVPILLVLYYPDNTEIFRKEDIAESVLEDGEIIISLMRKDAERLKIPFQEILQGYAHELVVKHFYTDTFQLIVQELEEKIKGRVRTELKINGDVTIKM